MVKELMRWVLVVTVFTCVVGCDSHDATLRAAIAKEVATDGNPLACAAVLNDVGRFPFAYHADGMLNHGADKKTLDELVKNGFLKSRPILVKSIYGGLNGEVVGSPQATEYSLTDLGRKYAQDNKFCIPNELAKTDVEADGSKRSLLVTQYFSAVKNEETLLLSKLLARVNPSLPMLMEQDLSMKFAVRTSIKEDVVSVEKIVS